jgi:hypothetical protein
VDLVALELEQQGEAFGAVAVVVDGATAGTADSTSAEWAGGAIRGRWTTNRLP